METKVLLMLAIVLAIDVAAYGIRSRWGGYHDR